MAAASTAAGCVEGRQHVFGMGDSKGPSILHSFPSACSGVYLFPQDDSNNYSIVAPEALRCSIFCTSQRDRKKWLYMKRKWWIWLLASVFIMIVLPGCVAAFAPSDAGLFFGILLLFAVNPAYSAVAGTFAGGNIPKMWGFPAANAILFLFGAWCFFDMGDPAFWGYAAIYLMIGMASMLIRRKVHL